jgi:hypothetical protein
MVYGIGYGSVQSFGTDTVRTPSGEKISENSAEAKALKRSGVIECETCKNRKYQDGSDEADVSFKAPGHISPESSGTAVRAHEQQHVSNAYQKVASGAKVLSASVSITTAVCPECGRSYTAGGVTRTAVRYDEESPYGKNDKSRDAASGAIGSNYDEMVQD